MLKEIGDCWIVNTNHTNQFLEWTEDFFGKSLENFLPEVCELHFCKNRHRFYIFVIQFWYYQVQYIILEYNYDSKNKLKNHSVLFFGENLTGRSSCAMLIPQPFSHGINCFGLYSQSIRWFSRRSNLIIAVQPSFSHEISKLKQGISNQQSISSKQTD